MARTGLKSEHRGLSQIVATRGQTADHVQTSDPHSIAYCAKSAQTCEDRNPDSTQLYARYEFNVLALDFARRSKILPPVLLSLFLVSEKRIRDYNNKLLALSPPPHLPLSAAGLLPAAD
jgi:hypothetical protein